VRKHEKASIFLERAKKQSGVSAGGASGEKKKKTSVAEAETTLAHLSWQHFEDLKLIKWLMEDLDEVFTDEEYNYTDGCGKPEQRLIWRAGAN
jgi:hypothetical protein